MNWTIVVVTSVSLTLVAVITFLMPLLTLPTVPLGVSIPRHRVSDPAVATAVRAYRIGVAVSYVVALGLSIALASTPPLVATLVPLLLVLAGIVVTYLTSRRGIQRAKRDGDWYRDLPVRLTASVTPRAEQSVPPAIGWYVGAAIVLMAAVVVGAAVFDALPDPIAVHWNASGVPDRFAPKSIWSVFGLVLTGFGTVALLYLVALVVRRSPIRSSASGSARASADVALAQKKLMQALLGQLTFVISLAFAVLAVVGWLAPGSEALVVATVIVLPIAILAVLLLFLARYRRAMSPAHSAEADPGEPRADAPDDDRFWKAGSFYVNRSDPAFVVPKRFGVGWTINLGHPGGIAIAVGLVLVIGGAIVFSMVASGGHTASR